MKQDVLNLKKRESNISANKGKKESTNSKLAIIGYKNQQKSVGANNSVQQTVQSLSSNIIIFPPRVFIIDVATSLL